MKLVLDCRDCEHVETYDSYDDLFEKQPNSVFYCPQCGSPAIDGVDEINDEE